MSEKKVIFIGVLPPPYGGVTVKDKMLYESVFKAAGVEFVDVMEAKTSPRKVLTVLCRIVRKVSSAQTVIIGTGAKWCDKLLLLLRRMLTGKYRLRKDMMIVMGGRYQEFIRNDPGLYRLLSQVGSIWVESEQMIAAFRKMGLERTYLFPNCREGEGEMPPRPHVPGEKLRLVFLSRICIEKGVDIIMKAQELWSARKAPVTLDFYGEVSDNIKERFAEFTGGG